MTSDLPNILKEMFPVLILCTVGGVLAGLMLQVMVDELINIPGLLVLLPAILAMRGNISGAVCSRLGSALHLGLIKPRFKWNKVLGDNIYASLILNVVMSLFLGMAAHYACVIFGFESKGIVILTAISLIAGTLAGIIMTGLSILIAILTYAQGLDPDNVVTPIILTIGDILTVLCLLFTAKLF